MPISVHSSSIEDFHVLYEEILSSVYSKPEISALPNFYSGTPKIFEEIDFQQSEIRRPT